MNLINFANLEMANQSPEGLTAEGLPGTGLFEPGLGGKGESKAFDATFKEQLGKDNPGLKNPGRGQQKEGQVLRERNPDSTGDKSVSSGHASLIKVKEPAGQKSPGTLESGLSGNQLDIVPELSGNQLGDVIPEVVVTEVMEEVSTQEVNGTAASVVEEEPVTTGDEDIGEKNGHPQKLNRQVDVSHNPSSDGSNKVPVENGMPEDESEGEPGNRRTERERPVEWTREHVNGNKLLPERTEKPDVPPQAQARFARESATVEQVGLPSGAQEGITETSLESPEIPVQAGEQILNEENPTGLTDQDLAKTFRAEERSGQPEVPARAQAQFVREGERPEVPAKAQAQFVREGERPSVPSNAQAQFVRDGERPVKPVLPVQAKAQFVRETTVVTENSIPDASNSADQGNLPVADLADTGKEAEHPVRRIRAHILNRNGQNESVERPVVASPGQGQYKQEGPVMERMLEIHSRIPEEAKVRMRNPYIQVRQQAETSQPQPSTSQVVAEASVTLESDTIVTEIIPETVSTRRRETPRDRYERLASTKLMAPDHVQQQSTASLKEGIEPSRRIESFLAGEHQESEKKERTRNKEKLENQDSRTEKISNGSGKSVSAISRVQNLAQVSSVSDAYLKIISTVERISQNAISSRVQLNIDLENGEEMKVFLKVAKGHLQTVFMTDSDGLRTAMKDGWEQFQRQMSERGLDSSLPEFRGSGENRENRDQANQSWNDLLDDAGFVNQRTRTEKPVEAVRETGNSLRPHSPGSHSLDTYA